MPNPPQQVLSTTAAFFKGSGRRPGESRGPGFKPSAERLDPGFRREDGKKRGCSISHGVKTSLKPHQIKILDIPIHILTWSHVLDQALEMIFSGETHQIVTANSHLLLEAQTSEPLKKACQNASLVLAESYGVLWAFKRLGHPVPVRIPGIDLAFELCKLAEKHSFPVCLFGGEPGVAKLASENLTHLIPGLSISRTIDGYFKPSQKEDILQSIALSQARLVLIGLGMPKQDIWISENLKDLPPALYMGVGGSFDVWSGRIKRAPPWFQKNGWEWLFRLYQEPWRWHRILQLPRFAFKVFRV